MMRENILALLLVISLFANAYLIFFYHSAIDQNTQIFGYSNDSQKNNFIIGENGEVVSITPSPAGELTPEVTYPDGDFLENSSDILAVDPDNGDEVTPTPEVTLLLSEEVTEPVFINPWATYNSSKFGFSFIYPRNWTVNEVVAGRTVLTLTAPIETGCDSDTSQCYEYIASFTVEIDQKPHTLVLEDYFNKAVSLLQLKYHITTTSKSAPAIMSNSRSYQIEYYTHDERGNADRSFMQYYTIIDGKGYIVSYFGPYSTWDNVYHHNKADAQRIVDSFSVTRIYKPA